MSPEWLAGLASELAGVVKTYGRDRLELEFRLGRRCGSAFVPGVPEAEWRRLKDHLDASAALSSPAYSNARELIHHVRGDTAKYVIVEGKQPHWLHKKRLRDLDTDVEASAWTCRASLSLEVADPPGAMPQPESTRFERHKQRWSYTYRCWSIDLTEVMSNLPHQLDNDGKSYEVEIELVDTAELFARPMADICEWGMRLARDMCDLMCKNP